MFGPGVNGVLRTEYWRHSGKVICLTSCGGGICLSYKEMRRTIRTIYYQKLGMFGLLGTISSRFFFEEAAVAQKDTQG